MKNLTITGKKLFLNWVNSKQLINFSIRFRLKLYKYTNKHNQIKHAKKVKKKQKSFSTSVATKRRSKSNIKQFHGSKKRWQIMKFRIKIKIEFSTNELLNWS